MSSKQNESVDSSKTQDNIATDIAHILRQDYKDSGSAIKYIERKTGASHHAIRNWYDAQRAPSLENFINLTKASPRLIEWFLEKIGKPDLAQLIQIQNRARRQSLKPWDFDLLRLIFETKNSGDLLIKMQKLTLRQLWFYAQVKQGHKLQAHDLVILFGIGRATAYRDIDELITLGLLTRLGKKPDEYYVAL